METMKMEATRMLDQKQNELDQKVERLDKQERELNNMVQRIIDIGIAPPDYINNEIEQTREEISASRDEIKKVQDKIDEYRNIDPKMWNGFPE
tara:strand:- start:843 stop:1121 length:279 start_codon:yes stop_codon:yes gene_type:complete